MKSYQDKYRDKEPDPDYQETLRDDPRYDAWLDEMERDTIDEMLERWKHDTLRDNLRAVELYRRLVK